MQRPSPDVLSEVIALIMRLRSGELDDGQIATVVERLDALLPDPNYLAYTIDHVPELPPADVVGRAFQYHPIEL